MEEKERKAIAALDQAGVPYVRIAHPAASTMELCRGIGEEYGAAHCKNLFLTNKRGTLFYLLLMDPDKPFRTSEVSRKLGVTRMSFGGPEMLREIMGLEQGSVTVLGLVNDCAKEAYREGRLRVAVDSSLFEREKLCVHPNTNTASLVIASADIKRFLDTLGIAYSTVDI